VSTGLRHRDKPFRGPLDWRVLVEWLSHDGIITPAEAERTIARCSAGASAQPPLQRLSVVGHGPRQ
jgi:general secretion pathway protein E